MKTLGGTRTNSTGKALRLRGRAAQTRIAGRARRNGGRVGTKIARRAHDRRRETACAVRTDGRAGRAHGTSTFLSESGVTV